MPAAAALTGLGVAAGYRQLEALLDAYLLEPVEVFKKFVRYRMQCACGWSDVQDTKDQDSSTLWGASWSTCGSARRRLPPDPARTRRSPASSTLMGGCVLSSCPSIGVRRQEAAVTDDVEAVRRVLEPVMDDHEAEMLRRRRELEVREAAEREREVER